MLWDAKLLVSAGCTEGVEVDTLGLEIAFGADGIVSQIGKAGDAYEVGVLDADGRIRQVALQETDEAAAHDHHDQEVRSFVGMLAQAGDGQREDTGPEGGAEKPDAG